MAAEGGGANAVRGGGDIGAGRLCQAPDKICAGSAGAGVAAPQPQFAVSGERSADRGEILCFIRQGSGRPFARGKVDTAVGAVGDHMHRIETAAAFERGGDLARRRERGVEDDCRDTGPQIAKYRVAIGDTGIDEEELENAAHAGLHWGGRVQGNGEYWEGCVGRTAIGGIRCDA